MRPDEVPTGPLLIDTDVFSWVAGQRGRHEEYSDLIRGHLLVLSFATVGELWAGANKSDWGERRRRDLEARITRYVTLTATSAVTQRFGAIYAKLRDQLQGGGVNDMWIVACALAQPRALPVVTGNFTDFDRIASYFPITIVHPDR